MNDELLIEYVRKYQELYNMADKKYSNNVYKERLWKRIGEKLNRPGPECKYRWVSLRDQFRRHVRKKAAKIAHGGTFSKKWKYEEEMSFILPFMRERESTVNFSDEDSLSNYAETHIDKQEIQNVEVEVEKQENTITPCKPYKSNLKTRKTASVLMKYIIDKKIQSETQKPDAIEAFFTAIASTVKQFSPCYQHTAKNRIFSIVSELEMKQILENQSFSKQALQASPPVAVTMSTSNIDQV